MAAKLPVVDVFGVDTISLETYRASDHEAKELDCRCYLSDTNLEEILVKDRPHVVVTIGPDAGRFPRLMIAPYEIRKRWIHFNSPQEVNGDRVFTCYLSNLFEDRRSPTLPLVTIFTPAFKSGQKILRPFRSLVEQTYREWEWIILDDSDDKGETFEELKALMNWDHRIKVFRPGQHSGIIGKVKNQACMLAQGEYLVELDHDDELTPNALADVVEAFRQFPEAGFVYSDCAEIFDDGTPAVYPDGWAFGYGSYRDELYKGKTLKVANAANINPKTIRHIVAVPNHVRCWRKSFYNSIGGHNIELHVADDYELIVRTFLSTRMVRIPRLCYLQYIHQSTQRVRNQDIQRHVRVIREHFDKKIHNRFIELGCDDFIWNEKIDQCDFSIANPEKEPHVTLTALC